MKIKKDLNYSAKSSKQMTPEIRCKYFAFLNAIKFINIGSRKRGINPDSLELDSRMMKNYINAVEGDILSCLKQKGGIPMKYSLDCNHEEAQDFGELQYT